MKRDIIERLAIDSAAGELSEDGQSLFQTYLSEHPGAKEWAEDMFRTYRQTEVAISSKIRSADTSVGAVSVTSRPPAYARWRPALRWAAIVFVAALVGAGAGRWSKLPRAVQEPEHTIASANPRVALESLDSEDVAGSFWRAKAAAMFEPRPYRRVNAAMQAGGLWRKYEHYIEEKYHD